MTHDVYVVDDDPDFRAAMRELLVRAGMSVRDFSGGAEMLAVLEPEFEGIILSDLKMPGLSGLGLLAEARKAAPSVPFILITGHGDIQAAVTATREGAFDFLEKPATPELVLATTRRALNVRKLWLENRRLRARISRGTDIRARILGHSEPVKALRKDVAAIAGHAIDVLIVGEPGTDKESIARVIHDFSGAAGEFVTLNGALLTEANLDEVLLGDGGARTGALSVAAGGTLHLERLAALSDALLMRLLSQLELRTAASGFRVVVSASPKEAADLPREFVFRLNLTEIAVPPLRDRRDDFFFLFEHYIREAVARHKRPFPEVSAAELRRLRAHSWPGNLRELRGATERLVIGLSVTLRPDSEAEAGPQSYDDAMREFETGLLLNALRRTGGRKAEAADSLGMPRKRLYLRLKACGL